ncbi:efflux RND transporter permease subunit [Aliarcobacter butzleri]
MGLGCKNAILIVELIENAYKKGKPLVKTANQGARLGLSPIIKSSLTLIAGVNP